MLPDDRQTVLAFLTRTTAEINLKHLSKEGHRSKTLVKQRHPKADKKTVEAIYGRGTLGPSLVF